MAGYRLRPAKWERLKACSDKCSLNPAMLGEDKGKIVHGWFEQGLNNETIAKNLVEMDIYVSRSTIARHRALHMRKLGETNFEEPVDEEEADISDLDALERILRQGARQIKNWRVTPSDFFKALDMKYKLTQGSVFEGMLEALAVAEDEMEEDEELEGVDEDESGLSVLREVYAEQSTSSGPEEVAEEREPSI